MHYWALECGHKIGLLGSEYEQKCIQKTTALELYYKINNVTETARRLGYPTREQLHKWINKGNLLTNKRKQIELVNKMLDKAIKKLNEDEHPILHSNRGCHYRWPGWIERMDKAGLNVLCLKKAAMRIILHAKVCLAE